MNQSHNHYDVIIAGAGPAGTSAAIHLAQNHANVLLLERLKFPRPKLCGEFLSPECLNHFHRLGVVDQMLAAAPASLSKTVFYSRRGQFLTIPSRWFDEGPALGLSRAVMDNELLRRARAVGVTVLENANVVSLIEEGERVRGVRVKVDGSEIEKNAAVTIDATGRSRLLAKKVVPTRHGSRGKLVAFKAHFESTRIPRGVCEIYFYSGGYGGLSSVEGGTANLCFIVSTTDVKRFGSNPERVMRETVMKNRRAALTLEKATTTSPWLSVSLESFGPQMPSPRLGLLAIGDAAAFIDPFTGSGMLMALESGALVSDAFVRARNKFGSETWLSELAVRYAAEYKRKFKERLRLSGILRRAAFKPRLAELGIAICGSSDWLRSRIAHATRTRAPAQP